MEREEIKTYVNNFSNRVGETILDSRLLFSSLVISDDNWSIRFNDWLIFDSFSLEIGTIGVGINKFSNVFSNNSKSSFNLFALNLKSNFVDSLIKGFVLGNVWFERNGSNEWSLNTGKTGRWQCELTIDSVSKLIDEESLCDIVDERSGDLGERIEGLYRRWDFFDGPSIQISFLPFEELNGPSIHISSLLRLTIVSRDDES